MDDLFIYFGLDKKETEVFLMLVRLGASPISVWAKHSGIKRSSMYVIVDRLVDAGVVSLFSHLGKMYARPISMADLPALLERKLRLIDEAKVTLISRLPQLSKLEATQAIRPTVRFYEGVTRVAAMYEEVLKEPSFISFFHPGRVKDIMPEYFHKIPLTLKSRGGRAKELLVRSIAAKEYVRLYESENHKMKFLPKGISFSSDTIITKEKIYLIGYGKRSVVGTEIWNTELAQTQASVFDLVWTSMR